MNFAFHLEEKGEVSARRVFGLLDLIVNFGGLAFGLVLIMYVFMGTYAQKLLQIDLVERLYRKVKTPGQDYVNRNKIGVEAPESARNCEPFSI